MRGRRPRSRGRSRRTSVIDSSVGVAAVCAPVGRGRRSDGSAIGSSSRVAVEQQDPDHHREDQARRRRPRTAAPASAAAPWPPSGGGTGGSGSAPRRTPAPPAPGSSARRRRRRARPARRSASAGRAGVAALGPQERGDLAHRPAQRRVAGHGGRDERRQPAAVLEPRRLLVHDPVERAEHVVAHVVRRAAGQRVEQRRAQRPHVAGPVASCPEATSGAR